MSTFAIIGGGQTAAVAARTLRRRGFDGRIEVIGAEAHRPYQRPPLTKEYLAGGTDEELFLLGEQWCADNDVHLRLGQRAVRIRPAEWAIDLADGTVVRADKVLIATGGAARKLPGVRGERVHYLRTLDDANRLRGLIRPGARLIAAKGLIVHPAHSYETVPALDVLIYPGGRGTRAHLRDEAQLAWVRRQRENVPLLTSVCTGSLVFAAAGLLARRPATTHWRYLSRLCELEPTVVPRPDERFVDDGDLITSAGVSAGIDMALHLLARLQGTERAREVRRGIQYDPAPPV